MERYIDNKALSSVRRPQPKKLCAIASLLALIHYIRGDVFSYRDVLTETDTDRGFVESGRVSNEKVVDMAQTYGLPLKIWNSTNIEKLSWEYLKKTIKSEKGFVIYHKKGHYCVVAGVIEEPRIVSSGDTPVVSATGKNLWVVIAEHRVKGLTGHSRGMLEMNLFRDIVAEIIEHKNCGLLIYNEP